MRINKKLLRIITLSYLIAVIGLTQVSLAQAQLNTNRPAQTTLPQYNQGVDKTIAEYLCVPSPNNVGTALYDCLDRVYRFGIVAGALALVFFMVWAGYSYMVGGEKGKESGKKIMTSALTGMVIILSSYVLLRFINPDLVKYKPIQPPIFTSSGLPTCEAVGYGTNCIITAGPNTGQVYRGSGSGPTSISQWKDLTTKYSQQYGLDTCVGYTIIRKESGSGDPSAIGHDNHNRSTDPFQPNNAPNYGLDFRLPNWSHGIGLTQITIFPEGSRQGGANWPSFPVIGGVKTPARRADTIPVKGEGSSKWYTIPDLLNPETSIRLALGKMAYHLQQTNSLEASFKAYNGAQVYATSAMGIYNECKSGKVGF